MTEEAMNEDVNTDEAVAPEGEAAPEGDASEENKEASADEAAADEKESGTLLSDDEGDDAGDDKTDDDAGEREPVEYEYEAPEGLDLSEEDLKRLDVFKEKANELELTQEQFKGVIDHNLEGIQALTEAQASAYGERIDAWAEDVRADKEFGGEKLQENLAVAMKVKQAYGSDGFQQLLDKPSAENPNGLGLGNHPEMIRFLHRVGKSIADSDFSEGDGHKVSDGNGLQRMYPTMDQFKAN